MRKKRSRVDGVELHDPPPVPPNFKVGCILGFGGGAKKTLISATHGLFIYTPTLKWGDRGASTPDAGLIWMSVFFALTGTLLNQVTQVPRKNPLD